MSLDFLLRYWKRTGAETALDMVKQTARKMAEGGMYDQLGGGFHRYSVDAVWLVPHFEKMLYDNAQLIRLYLHLFQICAAKAGAENDAEFFRGVAVQTLEYVKREMLDDSGGFYSSQDADSEGEEGKFFVWSPEEVVSVLGEDDARIFNFYYDVSDSGNFEGKNILHVSYTTEAAARALHVDPDELKNVLDRGRKKLFEHRESRIKPFRDEKILTGWNGLMLAAFADAAAILGNEDYLLIARQNADFLMSELQNDGRLLRTWKDGRSKLNGYIEDYANLADGLIQTFQASGDIRYLDEARRLADLMITEFWDEENGGFFFTSNDHEELIVRNKDFYDNATPSGNSAAADVLLRLSKFYGEEKYERFASTVLRLAAAQLKRYPQGFGRTLAAMEFLNTRVKEIVVLGERGNELESVVARTFLPNAVIALARESLPGLPLTADKTMSENAPTAFVCENFVCQRPVSDSESLLKLLSE
jgi:uncharacterized protein YyaL (SSP411 family)